VIFDAFGHEPQEPLRQFHLLTYIICFPARFKLGRAIYAQKAISKSKGGENENSYKKMYYNMSQPGADGWILPLIPFHFTLVDNIKRDPYEQAVGIDQKTAMSTGGTLGGPLTAFQYDWNLLPLGQQLWLDWFETLKEFPPMQAPESYNLTQIMDQFKSPSGHPSD
jgi:hypothetical protein